MDMIWAYKYDLRIIQNTWYLVDSSINSSTCSTTAVVWYQVLHSVHVD